MSMQVRLAVLGEPLVFTLSPLLHRAGLECLGLPGESQALPTGPAALGERLRTLAAAGFRGVNVTHPLKEATLAFLSRLTDDARRARSVNTVGFDADGWWGASTDGPGFLDLLAAVGAEARLERTHLLGAGGAARSLAVALAGAGVEITVSARDPARAAASWQDIAPVRFFPWRSPGEHGALRSASLVVNCTPLEEEPAPLADLAPGACVVDLVYGPQVTAWVAGARARGLQAYDGLGLLVFQARRSLALWTGRDVPAGPLARAVGWPR
jgi:shikimate dehydrogenase